MPILKNTKHQAIRLVYSGDPAQTGRRAHRKIYARRLQHAAEAHEAAAKSPIASSDEVLEELSKLALANIGHYMHVGANGDVVWDFDKLMRAQAAGLVHVTIKSFTRGRGKNVIKERQVAVKLCDKIRPLKLLGQYYGLFNGRQSPDNSDLSDIAEQMKEAIARVDGKKAKTKSDRIVTRRELKTRAKLHAKASEGRVHHLGERPAHRYSRQWTLTPAISEAFGSFRPPRRRRSVQSCRASCGSRAWRLPHHNGSGDSSRVVRHGREHGRCGLAPRAAKSSQANGGRRDRRAISE